MQQQMERTMVEGSLTFAMKLGGAVVGSTIAIVFRPLPDQIDKKERWWRIFNRFWIGIVIGFIFSPLLLDTLSLMKSPDYWLASSTFCGSMGVLILQILYSDAAADALKKRIKPDGD